MNGESTISLITFFFIIIIPIKNTDFIHHLHEISYNFHSLSLVIKEMPEKGLREAFWSILCLLGTSKPQKFALPQGRIDCISKAFLTRVCLNS